MIIAAYLCIYIVWGSTYLAIRMAIETMPPFAMASVRFFLASLILFFISKAKGEARLPRSSVILALVSGAMMLGLGNGLISFAEQTVSSGRVGLWMASVPVFVMILNGLAFEKRWPDGWKFAGAILGILGVGMLVKDSLADGQGGDPLHVALVFIAILIWCVGLLMQRRDKKHSSPLMFSTLQMFSASLLLVVMAFIHGDWFSFDPNQVSLVSALSILYLSLFGSILAFTAFSWLVTVSSAEKVSTYALVNPVIALVLGSIVLGERVGAHDWASCLLILFGVSLILFPVANWIKRLKR